MKQYELVRTLPMRERVQFSAWRIFRVRLIDGGSLSKGAHKTILESFSPSEIVIAN